MSARHPAIAAAGMRMTLRRLRPLAIAAGVLALIWFGGLSWFAQSIPTEITDPDS